jgi:signal transduction histidine kinase
MMDTSLRAQTDTACSPNGKKVLDQILRFMDFDREPEAQQLIIHALDNPYYRFNTWDRYFFEAHLAELMYFAGFNEQGLRSAQTGLKLAQELKNDSLIGSAWNLLGLIQLNARQFDNALHSFREAKHRLYAVRRSRRLSRYDQVLSNLSESFLKLNQNDSAAIYARKAEASALEAGFPRARSLAEWTLGEVHFQQKHYDSAEIAYRRAFEICPSNERDVQLHIASSLLRMYREKRESGKVVEIYERYYPVFEAEKSADFSRIQFLRDLGQSFCFEGLYRQCAEISRKQIQLMDTLRSKRERLNYRMLSSLVESEKQLSLAQIRSNQSAHDLRQTRLIQMILGVLVVALVAVFLLFRKRSIQEREMERLRYSAELLEIEKAREMERYRERLDAIEEERNRIARELHDEIGSAMSSVSIFADLARKEVPPDQPKLRELIQRIGSKNSEISESIADLIWAIYSGNNTWESLLSRIRNFCFEVLTSKGIEVKIHDDLALHQLELSVDRKKNLLLLFKEAINNIAKYSEASLVVLHLEVRNDAIYIRIQDNGKGFDPQSVQKGNGLLSLRKRARAMNGTLELQSRIGEGTSIDVHLPSVS